MPEEFEIDATDKVLGRLASEIAVKLQGKHRIDFKPNVVADVSIRIKGVRSLRVTGKKMENKRYFRHSGYIGNLKSQTLQERLEKEPERVLYDAVSRMLPKNRLRAKLLKNLLIEK